MITIGDEDAGNRVHLYLWRKADGKADGITYLIHDYGPVDGDPGEYYAQVWTYDLNGRVEDLEPVVREDLLDQLHTPGDVSEEVNEPNLLDMIMDKVYAAEKIADEVPPPLPLGPTLSPR